jgi:hypothetical protein
VPEALEFPPRVTRETARSKAAILFSCSSAGSLPSACSAMSANSRANSRVVIFFFPAICFSKRRERYGPNRIA